MSTDSWFLFGEFSPGRLGHSYQRAFNSVGVATDVLSLSELKRSIPWPVRNRVGHRLTIRSRFIREAAAQKFNRLLEKSVIESRAGTFLNFSLQWVLPETLCNLRSRGIRVICFYADNPFPPHYMARPETLATARETDLCLIWSEQLAARLKEAGVPNTAFLPFGWDAEAFPYQNDQPQGSWPGVLFLGGWDREREEFLSELASHMPLQIYGPDYWGRRTKPSSRARRCWQGTDLRLGNAAKVIRESAVCLNVLRTQHVIDGSPDGLIMRHFEVPGAGGFLLSTRSGGATRLFPEGQTGEYFSSVAECIEKAKMYISDNSARIQLTERAHAAVAADHQYADRVREILRLIDGNPNIAKQNQGPAR